MKRLLIVVDMQNDFITGSLGTPEAQAIVPNVKAKIEEYKANGDDIIFTRDTHSVDYLKSQEGKRLPVKHCIKGTWGWIIADEVNYPEYYCIDKHNFGYDCWDSWISEDRIYQIEIVGLVSDICVISNALVLKAKFPEIFMVVDAKCCAGTTPEKHVAALETMKSCQIAVIGEY